MPSFDPQHVTDGGTAPQMITVRTDRTADVVVVSVAGEVDMDTAAVFSASVQGAAASGVSAIVVDLTAVSFFASSGLRVLAELRETTQNRAINLRLVVHRRAVLRPLEITGLRDGFQLCSSVREAMHDLGVRTSFVDNDVRSGDEASPEWPTGAG